MRWLELNRPSKAAIAMEALSNRNIAYERDNIDDYITRTDERALVHVEPVLVTLDQLDTVIDQVRAEQEGTRWVSRCEDAYETVAQAALEHRMFYHDRDGGL